MAAAGNICSGQARSTRITVKTRCVSVANNWFDMMQPKDEQLPIESGDRVKVCQRK